MPFYREIPSHVGAHIIGATSPDTAHVVADYPYGFTTRTKIRYWAEYNPRHGMRVVSQTLNPKTGAWNKPKAGTYSPAVVLYHNAQDGHVEPLAASWYDEDEYIEAFAARFADALPKPVNALLAYVVKARRAKKAAADNPS